jgi:hypothetical protein
LNSYDLQRNTTNYNFKSNDTFYPYLNIPSSQFGRIEYSSFGGITKIESLSVGNNYQVNDTVIVKPDINSDVSETIRIKSLKGKDVEKVEHIKYSVNNIEVYPLSSSRFIGFSTESHSFNEGDFATFSGFSTSISNKLNSNVFSINVPEPNYFLNSNLENSIVTGDFTYIKLIGDLTFPNLDIDDILTIDEEKVKVLSIDRENGYLRIQREIDGTIGVAHSFSSLVTQSTRKIDVNLTLNVLPSSNINRTLYFDPAITVSIASTHGVGIGNTIPLPNVSIGNTQIFIPSRSIYYKDHFINTGDRLVYSSNGGDPIKVSLDGSTSYDLDSDQELYGVRISDDLVGISTVKLVETGSGYKSISTDSNYDLVYFTYEGTGNNHQFRTILDNTISLNVTRNLIKVSTAQTHGLSVGDNFNLNVLSGVTTTYKVIYNDKNRRMIINPYYFDSSDIDIQNNLINIENHSFKTGDKLICKTVNSIFLAPNSNDSIYYCVYNDENSIKLAENYYNSIL